MRHSAMLLLMLAVMLAIAGCTSTLGAEKTTDSPFPDHSATRLTPSPLHTVIQPEHAGAGGLELDGIAAGGYVLKNIWEDEYGWDVFRLCRELGIRFQASKPAAFAKSVVPVDFTLSSGKTVLTFKGDTSRTKPEYMQYPESANLAYQAYRNGKKLSLQAFSNRGRNPHILDPEALLRALDLNVKKVGATLYVDAGGKERIKGKLLDHRILNVSGKSLDLKLVYAYKDLQSFQYKSIGLMINDGVRQWTVPLFDAQHPGSSSYYASGFIEALNFSGNLHLVQVQLDGDTFIFELKDDRLLPVFSLSNYKTYLEGNLLLQTDGNGNHFFADRLDGILEPVKLPAADKLPPASDLVMELNFFGVEQTPADGKIHLSAGAYARYKGRNVFTATLEYGFNGETFVPERVFSIDGEKWNQLKMQEKLQNSKDYMRFDDPIKRQH